MEDLALQRLSCQATSEEIHRLLLFEPEKSTHEVKACIQIGRGNLLKEIYASSISEEGNQRVKIKSPETIPWLANKGLSELDLTKEHLIVNPEGKSFLRPPENPQ